MRNCKEKMEETTWPLKKKSVKAKSDGGWDRDANDP